MGLYGRRFEDEVGAEVLAEAEHRRVHEGDELLPRARVEVFLPLVGPDANEARADDVQQRLESDEPVRVEQLEDDRTREGDAKEVAHRHPCAVLRKSEDPQTMIDDPSRDRIGKEEDAFQRGGDGGKAVEGEPDAAAQVRVALDPEQKLQAPLVRKHTREFLVSQQPIHESKCVCNLIVKKKNEKTC